MPQALCTTPALTVQQPTVAARSINCGSARASSQDDELVCPKGQFIFGFEDWRSDVFAGHFLPLGPVRCCDLILQERDIIYDIEPCQCADAPEATGASAMARAVRGLGAVNSVSCPSRDQLIVGFPISRYSFEDRLLPTSPVRCCRACVTSKRRNDDQQCMLMTNNCNGRGRCVFGSCSCYEGFTGDDCSWEDDRGHKRDWWSANASPMVLVILVTGAGLSLGVVIANLIAIVTWYRQNADEEGEASARGPNGSNGSAELREHLLGDESSSDDDSDDEMDADDSGSESEGGDGDEESGAHQEEGADCADGAAESEKDEAWERKQAIRKKLQRQRQKREHRIELVHSMGCDSCPHDFLCPITVRPRTRTLFCAWGRTSASGFDC